MKNRNWLVLALCAMMGTGAVACGDDGGSSSGLKVTPESVELEAYIGTQSVEISGLPADTPIVVESMKPECAGVINVENLVSGLDGKASFVVVAAGNDCTAKVSVDANGETKNINVKVNASDGSAPTGDYVITLDPEILDISGAGAEANTKITYKQGNTVLGGRTLKVSKVGGEENCVEFSTSPVTNRSTGEVDFKVKALKDNCNVKLLVEDALPSIQGEHKELSVYVGGVTDGKINGSVMFTKPTNGKLEVIYSAQEGTFEVLVTDENSKGIKDINVALKSSDETCVTLRAKNIRTGDDGKAVGTVDVQKAECTSNITATALGTSDTIEVEVKEQDKYNVNLKLSLNHPIYSRVAYAGVILSEVACDELDSADPQSYKNVSPDYSVDSLEGLDKPELTTFKLENVESNMVSAVAYAKVNGSKDSAVLAYKCQTIGVKDHNSTVDVELKALMPDIVGKYQIVSNFDLTSGFAKTPCNVEDTYKKNGICVPKLEKMLAGDWIKFVTDFCKDPLMTLLEFAWSNTILRLGDIESLKQYTWLTNLLNDPHIKATALAALEPSLTELLSGTGDWYKILNTVAPDVADLVSNMQLAGTLEVISKSDNQIIEATHKYSQLQYQWSYKEPSNKLANAYGVKEGSWRRPINLDDTKYDTSISGTWTGTLSDDVESSVDYDALLNIENHKISLKWATLLYTAVFGSILPDALGYYEPDTMGNSTNPSIKNGFYIKALLEELLFKPIVDSYNSKPENANALVDTTDKTKYCDHFISALIYMIYPEAATDATIKNILSVVAGFACDAKGIGQLDSLALGALSTVEASNEVDFMLKADNCEMTANEFMQFASYGTPDTPKAYTANEVFDGNMPTMRCIWDLNTGLVSNDKDVIVKGLFHATRID